MLMPVLEFQKEACRGKYAGLARFCGLADEGVADEEAAERFLQAVRELMARCGMDRIESPVRRCDHEALIPLIAADSVNYSSPVTLSNDQIRQILETVTNTDTVEASEYTDDVVRDIVAVQRRYFRTGATLPVSWRIKQLKRL